MKKDRQIIEEKAELLKALSSPARLCIIKTLLDDGEKNVTDIINCMDLSQSSISQQLTKLKSLGLVKMRKDGNMCFYRCDREDIRTLVSILFDTPIGK